MYKVKRIVACLIVIANVLLLGACKYGFSGAGINDTSAANNECYGPNGETIIVFRTGACSQWLRNRIADYNYQSKDYEVVIDECERNDDISIFRERTSVELSTGRGADIYDIYSLTGLNPMPFIEKGLFEETTDYISRQSDIIDNILNIQRIDGRLYSVPVTFELYTMYINQEIPYAKEEWNYQNAIEFAMRCNAQCLCDKPIGWSDAETGMAALSILGGGIGQYETFCNKTIQNCSFDSAEFVELIQYIRNHLDYSKKTDESSIMFHATTIQNFQSFFQNNIGDENNKEIFIGFPTDSGGTHYLMTRDMYVNKNSIHKDGIYDFLDYLLSGEEQKKIMTEIDGAFSVRKDVLKAFWDMAKTSNVSENIPEDALGNPLYESRLLTEKEESLFWEMVENAKLFIYDDPIEDIVQEEVIRYFEGQAEAQEIATIIQKRVQLFLDENGLRR